MIKLNFTEAHLEGVLPTPKMVCCLERRDGVSAGVRPSLAAASQLNPKILDRSDAAGLCTLLRPGTGALRSFGQLALETAMISDDANGTPASGPARFDTWRPNAGP